MPPVDIGTAYVSVEPDFRGFDRRLNAQGSKLSQSAAKWGKRIGAGLAGVGAAAIAAGPKLIDLASDANETASKFRVVFGKETPRAIRELDRFSKATGTSKFALRDQASGLQALIRPMGLSADRAADMSTGMTKLATDLASFNNTDVETAIDALKSGLVGESEPLRQFGVQLSQARIEAYAYAKGIAKQGAELTSAQRAQASYGLVLKDTKLAQGDATRTAGSFANQWKRLKSQATDLATELGMKLLPVVTRVVGAITGFIGSMRDGDGPAGSFRHALNGVVATAKDVAHWIAENKTVLADLGIVLGVGATALLAYRTAMAVSAAATAVMTAAQGALNVALLANPVGLVVAGVVALGAGLVLAYKHSEAFRNVVGRAFTVVKAVAVDVFDGIKQALGGFVTAIKGVVDVVAGIVTLDFGRAWDGVKEIFSGALGAILGQLHVATAPFREAAAQLGGKIVDGIKSVGSAIAGVGGWAVNRVADGVKSVARFAGDVGGWIKNRVLDGIRGYIGAYETIGGWVVNRIADGVRAVAQFAADIGGWVKNRVSDGVRAYADGLVALGSWITNRLAGGIKAVGGFAGDVGGWVKNRVVDGVRAFADGFVGAGGWIVGRIASGLRQVGDKVHDAVVAIKNAIVSAVKDVFKEAISIPLKIHLPSIPNPFGGKGGGNVGPTPPLGTGVDSVTPIASGFGLQMTSGFRPGDRGWHGRNRARDYSNGVATPQELQFARFMSNTYGPRLLELIHTPLGFGIKNGAKVPLSFWGSKVNADHFDHVHVALRDGGYVRQGGWALVGEEGPEIAKLPTGTTVYPHGYGPVGAPRVMTTGGQQVLTRDDQQGGQIVHVHNVYLDGKRLDAKIDTRVEKVTRGVARRAATPRPGSGGRI